MRIVRVATIVALAGVGASACGVQSKEDFGTVSGALAGGLIASQATGDVTATMLGALVGGVIGNRIGAALDAEDRRRAVEAEYRALQWGRSGQPVYWRGDRSGVYGMVTPGPLVGSCRTYTHKIYVDGREQAASGRACRKPDGTWGIVS